MSRAHYFRRFVVTRFVQLLVCFLMVALLAVPVCAQDNPDAKAAQDDLKTLYHQLLELKKTQEFTDRGFAGNPWIKDVRTARDRAEKGEVPIQIKQAFTVLMNLGDLYLDMRRKPIRDLYDLNNREESLYEWRADISNAIYMKLD